jgi:hypothetical protein
MAVDQSLETFANSVRGAVLRPADQGYESARRIWNAMIDRSPAVIVRCADPADVVAAVNFARDQQQVVAVHSGGHSAAGSSVCDGGFMIDLSPMKGIRVDPARATVRAEAGLTGAEFDAETQAFGLATTSGVVSTTGIAGLTLGGGTGYLTRKHGLTIDNLLEADVVLADGRFVTASTTQNRDLFWALRGGGGNFGVVTSFVFRAHPASMVYAGPIMWDIKHARQVMQWYREFLAKAPLELCSFLGVKTVPSTEPFPKEIWGKKIVTLISCYNGSAADGEKAIAPIRKELPAAILDWVGPMPFPAIQSMFDGLLPKGLQWYWKGAYVKELPDNAIDVHLEYAMEAPSELSLVHLYPIDGAVHRVGRGDTAWDCRDATWSMVIAAIDPNPEKAGQLKRWGRTYWEAINAYTTGGGYVNFMMGDEGDARIKSTYGGNFDRLIAVKREYDPNNFFRVNQNIKP